DIPYWSMSAVITTDPSQRVKIVTMTRLIGGLGSGITIGAFWTVNKFAADAGFDRRTSIFLAALVFVVFGTILLLQGFFNTKERAQNTATGNERFFENLKYIPKSKPLMINLIAGMLMSVMMIGATAMTTYFVKWNIKEIFPDIVSNDLMSIFTPVIGILPALAMAVGLFAAPLLIKKMEKRNVLIIGCLWGILANVIFYFIGYENVYIFTIGRFLSFLPVGIWMSVTTIMIGDSVDDIQYKTGKRVEGTCFSLLTFIGKFQNGVNVALTGLILSAIGYEGTLNADLEQQTGLTLHGIFIMVTLIPALGFLLMGIPFIFYDFTKSKHQAILDALKKQGLLNKSEENIIGRD
ncbi:MAG: MFS transporter, partial [Bacillota bacterium]